MKKLLLPFSVVVTCFLCTHLHALIGVSDITTTASGGNIQLFGFTTDPNITLEYADRFTIPLSSQNEVNAVALIMGLDGQGTYEVSIYQDNGSGTQPDGPKPSSSTKLCTF